MLIDVPKMLLSATLKNYPAIYAPVARLREGWKKRMIRRHTDLVVEGYWRCGNHYAVFAFLAAQGRPMEVAHHFHAPAQLMLAARWNVPAVLLIREPIEAVASATVFLERSDPRPFLKFYNTFHKYLPPLADRLVVSDFPTTTGDFGRVIEAVNAKWNRDYAVFRGTPEEEAKVEAMIRAEHAQNMGSNAATLPLPSAEKSRRKEQILERLHSPACASLLDQARREYEILRKFAL